MWLNRTFHARSEHRGFSQSHRSLLSAHREHMWKKSESRVRHFYISNKRASIVRMLRLHSLICYLFQHVSCPFRISDLKHLFIKLSCWFTTGSIIWKVDLLWNTFALDCLRISLAGWVINQPQRGVGRNMQILLPVQLKKLSDAKKHALLVICEVFVFLLPLIRTASVYRLEDQF